MMETAHTRTAHDPAAADDLILPFQAERAGASGRLARLGPAVDDILRGHNYPEPVCKLLGEAVALTALLGASLKFDGKFIFQTKTDGPVNMLVIDYLSTGELRGYARFDAAAVAALEASGEATPGRLLGHGHLAMTIDRGPAMDGYQGVVAVEGTDLNEAADAYFRQSEQLPTFIRVAVARHYSARSGEGNGAGSWHWRAGGLLVQHLTRQGGRGAPDKVTDEDGWNRARILAATVREEELVDPMLAPERLLYRLFHEERVRAFRARPLSFRCGCSEERVREMLARFGAGELEDMAEDDGRIRVTCEFCNTAYDFAPGEFS